MERMSILWVSAFYLSTPPHWLYGYNSGYTLFTGTIFFTVVDSQFEMPSFCKIHPSQLALWFMTLVIHFSLTLYFWLWTTFKILFFECEETTTAADITYPTGFIVMTLVINFELALYFWLWLTHNFEILFKMRRDPFQLALLLWLWL